VGKALAAGVTGEELKRTLTECIAECSKKGD